MALLIRLAPVPSNAPYSPSILGSPYRLDNDDTADIVY
jgi:hypothetical protein